MNGASPSVSTVTGFANAGNPITFYGSAASGGFVTLTGVGALAFTGGSASAAANLLTGADPTVLTGAGASGATVALSGAIAATAFGAGSSSSAVRLTAVGAVPAPGVSGSSASLVLTGTAALSLFGSTASAAAVPVTSPVAAGVTGSSASAASVIATAAGAVQQSGASGSAASASLTGQGALKLFGSSPSAAQFGAFGLAPLTLAGASSSASVVSAFAQTPGSTYARGSAASSASVAVTGISNLAPTPGYVVTWVAGQSPEFFPAKTPLESIVLEFNFATGLPLGSTITGILGVTYTVLAGEDNDPDAIANGEPVIDPSGTKVYVPVLAGLEGVGYLIDVEVSTTNGLWSLEIGGVLLVTAWSAENWPDPQPQPEYVTIPNYTIYWQPGQAPQFLGAKTPGSSVVLTYDFAAGLPTGATLSGTPTVTFSVAAGADADPSALANGTAAIDSSGTLVTVPVTGGLESVGYIVDVEVGTTSADLVLDLPGALWVSAWGAGNWPPEGC